MTHYSVLLGVDWNDSRPQILTIPNHMMDPEFYPLKVGDRVIAVEDEEMLGTTGTILEIWQATETRWEHHGVGTWLCKVELDKVSPVE